MSPFATIAAGRKNSSMLSSASFGATSLFLLLLLQSTTTVSAACGESLSSNLLTALREAENGGADAVSLFAPSVYYSDSKTKFVTARNPDYDGKVYDDWLCVDGAASNDDGIQLYDDGTNGDDFANDGIYSRDCVHICDSFVDFSDLYGFARSFDRKDGSHIVALDVTQKGTVPYEAITTPMFPGVKMYASSHAFFFSDVERKYYPGYPWSQSPNRFAGPSGENVPVSALLQVFGDVFDFVTVTNLEGRTNALNGWYIVKWQQWDRRAGPMLEQPIGDIEACATAMSGVNAYRLNGVLVGGEVVTGDGNDGLLHELIHGVSGYSYHAKLDAAISGDNIHVPGECTVDHSPLQGPVFDWVTGYPNGINRSDGKYPNYGIRLEANPDCFNCPEGQLRVEDCCTFRYENRPHSKDEMMANPHLSQMSSLMKYIAGMLTEVEIPADQKKFYCLGSNEYISKVDDSNRNNVTGDFVTQFTFDDLVMANGGSRFPKKKNQVIRNAAIHFSLREPSEAEITFYTLLWRYQETATEPWQLLEDKYGRPSFPSVPWNWVTGGDSILHSRLHGIDCGNNNLFRPPSCDPGSNAVCDNNPCGAGAICKNLDGQPLCICKDGLVGDGIECAYPSETGGYAVMNSAHSLSDDCFAKATDGSIWKNFVSEDSLPPYPGGQEPYAATSCFGKGVCKVGERCNKKKGCLPPSSRKFCQGRGLNKGQCLALGCCKYENNTCKKGNQFQCAKNTDPNSALNQCADKNTCCYFACNALEQSYNGVTISQRGNCQAGCIDSVQPDVNGIRHWEVYLEPDHYYAYNQRRSYDDEDGPFNILGEDKNMYRRCKQQCFKENSTDTFLFKIRKNGTLNIKTCNWLNRKPETKKRDVCREFNISHQGVKHASLVCTDACAPYVSATNTNVRAASGTTKSELE